MSQKKKGIFGQIIICGGCYLAKCRMLGSVPGRSQVMAIKNVSRHCQFPLGGQNCSGGLRTTALWGSFSESAIATRLGTLSSRTKILHCSQRHKLGVELAAVWPWTSRSTSSHLYLTLVVVKITQDHVYVALTPRWLSIPLAISLALTKTDIFFDCVFQEHVLCRGGVGVSVCLFGFLFLFKSEPCFGRATKKTSLQTVFMARPPRVFPLQRQPLLVP